MRSWGIALAACGHAAVAPPTNRVEHAMPTAVDARAHVVTMGTHVYAVLGTTLVAMDESYVKIATREHVTAITAAKNHLYAAIDGGEIAELDPRTLEWKPVGSLHETATWLGMRGDELIAAGTFGVARVAIATGAVDPVLLPTGASASYRIGKASTFLLDGDRLWYGIDAGEWGGGLGVVDLTGGAGCAWELLEGAFGIVRTRDRVFAYGGLVHLGKSNGYLAAVPEPVGHPDCKPGDADLLVDVVKTVDRPIVAIVPHRDGFVGIAWNEIYDVSTDLGRWTKRTTLAARAGDGRPDAMSPYPAITGVLDVGDATLIATVHDGLWSMRDGQLAQLLKPPS